MFSRGLPPGPKPPQKQHDEVALDDAWRNAARRGAPVTIVLSADDDREWRAVGRDRAKNAEAHKAKVADPYAGLTDEQRILKKMDDEAAVRHAEGVLEQHRARWQREMAREYARRFDQ